jgi:hypothetical protein
MDAFFPLLIASCAWDGASQPHRSSRRVGGIVRPGEEAVVSESAARGRGSAKGAAVGGCAERRRRPTEVRGGSTNQDVREGWRRGGVASCCAARGAAAQRMCQSRGEGCEPIPVFFVFLIRDPGLLDG